MVMSKSDLMNQIEKASSEKYGYAKMEILKKQLDAFYDPDDVVCYAANNTGDTLRMKASDIEICSIRDPFGEEVAVITADGVVRDKAVPVYISDMVDSLAIELTEVEEDSVKKILTDFMMMAFLEGRNLF